METPITTSPLSLYLLENSTYQGVSGLQPRHHVAQKLSKTTLPLQSDSLTGTPTSSFKEKPGAVLREPRGVISSAALTSIVQHIMVRTTPAIPAARRCRICHVLLSFGILFGNFSAPVFVASPTLSDSVSRI